MFKKSKARTRNLQPGAQKYRKTRNKVAEEKGIFGLLEQLIPSKYRYKLYEFAEYSFHFYTSVGYKLCLLPVELSPSVEKKGVLVQASMTRRSIHYAILILLVLSMMHKSALLIDRLLSFGLDMTAFFISATFLCYFVSMSISSSVVFLQGETIDLVNGSHKILATCVEEDENSKSVFADTKTAVVMMSLAVVAMVIGTAISVGVSFVFPELPVSFYSIFREYDLISKQSDIPSFVWMLILWPLELAQYMLPAFRSGWAGMVFSQMVMVVIRSAERLR